MRIVHVTPFYHPVIGGVEEVVKRIAEFMVSKGYEVHVVTYNRLRDGKIGSLSREEVINGVHVIRLKPDFIWSHGTYSSELPEIIRKLRPDIVHVHVWRHPHVFQIAKLKEKLGFKAILHGHAPFHKLSQIGLMAWLYYKIVDTFMKDVLEKYDVLIALTPYEKEMFTKKMNVYERKITVIPNGITDKLISITSNITAIINPTILYLGRISRSKNLSLLVKAMGCVKKELPDIQLVMAGSDEGLIIKLRDYAHRHNISLKYLGVISENDKIKLYRECLIFAHPAFYEPFGITLLEAQAFGKPCIITGEGGQLYSAPPGKTSLYVKPNPQDFGNAILTLLNDKELYRKLSINARKWASQHTWSKILLRYQEIYN